MYDNQKRIILTIIGLVLVIVAVLYLRSDFMDECVKSGHTARYCEFEFWKR